MTYRCEIWRTYGEGGDRPDVDSEGGRRTSAGCSGTDFKPIPPLNFTHSPSQVNDFFLQGDNLLVTVWGQVKRLRPHRRSVATREKGGTTGSTLKSGVKREGLSLG